MDIDAILYQLMPNQTIIHESCWTEIHRNVTFTNLMTFSISSIDMTKKDLWESPRGTVIRIEILVVVAVFLQLFLVFFGSRRRRSRNFFIQKGVLAAFTLSPSLVSYTLGSMQSSAIKSGMYSMWAISLYILFGSADSITAYSLTDNSQLMRQFFQAILGSAYVITIVVTTLDLDRVLPLYFPGVTIMFPLIFLLALVASSYFGHRILACRMASESWFLNKMVADYMYQEHTKSREAYDPATMKGYHYLVECTMRPAYTGGGKCVTQFRTAGPSDPKIIDLDMVWQNEDLSPDLKDACLSFSLFHLLRRRFFGFECGESSQPKTRDLVFKGLLAKKKEGMENDNDNAGGSAAVDYDWIFKVIEIELDFMYDFFFTKYAAIYYGNLWVQYVLPLVTATLTVVTSFLTARGLLRPPSKDIGGCIVDTPAEVDITVAVLVCISFVHVVQVMYYWTTIWGRVSFVCQRIKTKGRCMGLKEILVTIGLWVSSACRWQWHHQEQKLGQYSLLQSVSNFSANQSQLTKFLIKSLERKPALQPRFLLHPAIQWSVRSVIRKPGEPAELLAAVKKALVQSLERTHRHGSRLTNGSLSLSSSGATDLLWACSLELRQGLELGSVSLHQKENQVCVILTWHIATCYCDKESSASGTNNEHYEVATRLSKYCAYLVAFAPKLLPGHHYDTWLAFTGVAEEALKGAGDNDEETIYHKGLKLGEQLKNVHANHYWEVLAGFWTEMLLYVAPSDNVQEHVECLAKGGEFITHLWALLTHAGILDRGQSDAPDIENNGGNQSASPPTTFVPNTQNVEEQQPRQEQVQCQPHTEEIHKINPVIHHDIEEEEADRGANVLGSGGFSSLPAQHNYDSNASSSANNQPPVESVE